MVCISQLLPKSTGYSASPPPLPSPRSLLAVHSHSSTKSTGCTYTNHLTAIQQVYPAMDARHPTKVYRLFASTLQVGRLFQTHPPTKVYRPYNSATHQNLPVVQGPSLNKLSLPLRARELDTVHAGPKDIQGLGT